MVVMVDPVPFEISGGLEKKNETIEACHGMKMHEEM